MNHADPKKPQALLFLCHLSDTGYIDLYRSIARAFKPYGDAYFVFDISERPLPDVLHGLPHFTFSSSSLKKLGYEWLQDSLMPGHVHFPMLDFALQHPDYENYWVIEYDVRFSGPWRLFFWWSQHLDADFIASHIYRFDEQPFWFWWSSLTSPDKQIDPKSCVRFFGPLYRISRQAVGFLDASLKNGCKGHQEVVIPSLLHHAGFQLMDLSRKCSLGKTPVWSWYTRARERDAWGALNDSSMRFRPTVDAWGMRPLTLYHPVKTPDTGFVAFMRRILATSRSI
jgi:hypothetical protein